MTILYINNEICDTFEQLKGFFRQEQLCDNAVYSDLLDISRHGEISAWLMENGREELAKKVDAIDSKVGDSEYIGLLAKVMTGTTDVSFSKPAIEDVLAWTDLKIDKNQEDNYAKVAVSFKVLKAVNETYEVRISSDWGDAFRLINTSNYKELSTINENIELRRRPDRELGDVKLFYDGNELVKTIDIPKAVYKTSHKPSKKTFTVGDVSFDMIFVEGGNVDGNSDVILDDFYIGEFVVTEKLWATVWKQQYRKRGFFSNGEGGPDYPVCDVSLDVCNIFIDKLNKRTKGSFRLPTKAEWEYAAKGGKFSKGYKYSGSDKIKEVAWCGGISGNSGSLIHEVGKKEPNELGLYDMCGNVREWMAEGILDIDFIDRPYYQNNQVKEARYSKGELRGRRICTVKGGSFFSEEQKCLIFHNDYCTDDGAIDIGLRLVFG